VGVLRRDPMAMLPFCGYNMGDYFKHWLNIGRKMANPPKIFSVNWFRTNDEGKFIWPGFGDNIRVLKWIVDRVNNSVQPVKTPVGFVPHQNDLNFEGLNISKKDMDKLFEVRVEDWKQEVNDIKTFIDQFGSHLPQGIRDEYVKLSRLV